MGQLFDQPDILQERRPSWSGGRMLRLSVTGVPEAWASGGCWIHCSLSYSLGWMLVVLEESLWRAGRAQLSPTPLMHSNDKSIPSGVVRRHYRLSLKCSFYRPLRFALVDGVVCVRAASSEGPARLELRLERSRHHAHCESWGASSVASILRRRAAHMNIDQVRFRDEPVVPYLLKRMPV